MCQLEHKNIRLLNVAENKPHYRTGMLFRLENFCCLGFSIGTTRPGQKGIFLFRVWQPRLIGIFGSSWLHQLGPKRLLTPTWRAHNLVPVGLFFPLILFSFLFYFNYTFALEFNLSKTSIYMNSFTYGNYSGQILYKQISTYSE